MRDFKKGPLGGLFALSADPTIIGKVEVKHRGMSDVDDTNIKVISDNMTNMIDLQLQKMKSNTLTKSSGGDQSPETSPQRSRKRFMNSSANGIEEEEKKSGARPNHEAGSDDEFYDCFDDVKDAKMLESNISAAEPSMDSLIKPIRRTASFSDFNRIDEESGEEDGGEEGTTSKDKKRMEERKRK